MHCKNATFVGTKIGEKKFKGVIDITPLLFSKLFTFVKNTISYDKVANYKSNFSFVQIEDNSCHCYRRYRGRRSLFMYMLRAHTYLGDDPAACVNCHIMSPYYATWFHSSHARDATCNDCHVPHENAVKKWTFKGD